MQPVQALLDEGAPPYCVVADAAYGTEAEIRQAARYAPPPEFMDNAMFQTNGQFDANKYAAFLSSPLASGTCPPWPA